MNDSTPILGLDLGTCTCLACVVYQGKTIFIQPDGAYPGRVPGELDYPGELMPSVFCVKDGEPVVGHRAREELSSPKHARNVVREVKRLMHLDLSKVYPIGGRNYTPSEITAEYVKILIKAAARELKLPATSFRRVVVTVPADFLPPALEATKRACVRAGLIEENVQFVDEPVAAAYSLGLHLEPGKKRVLMIDLGGGTFDVALWDVGRDAGPFGFNELGRDGDTLLGGLNWDREIADWTLREIKTKSPEDFPLEVIRRLMTDTIDPGNAKLFEAAESAKFVLSTQMNRAMMFDPSRPLDFLKLSKLYVGFRHTTEAGEKERSAQMPAELFFDRTTKLLNRCVQICERLFHDVKTIEGRSSFGWADLDCVYLAGGGSRLPIIQRRFAECWRRPPVLNENPQHAVVKGAAMLAELWRKGQALPSIIGKTRYKRTIGLLVQSNQAEQGEVFHPIIPRNQELPFSMSRSFPILGNRGGRSLRLRFAEQQFHHDGPRHEPIKDLVLKDLPEAPPAGSPSEEAVVTIQCGIDGEPTFRLAFRGRGFDENLANLPEAPRHSTASRNGFATSPDQDARNGTVRPRSNGSS